MSFPLSVISYESFADTALIYLLTDSLTYAPACLPTYLLAYTHLRRPPRGHQREEAWGPRTLGGARKPVSDEDRHPRSPGRRQGWVHTPTPQLPTPRDPPPSTFPVSFPPVRAARVGPVIGAHTRRPVRIAGRSGPPARSGAAPTAAAGAVSRAAKGASPGPSPRKSPAAPARVVVAPPARH